MSKPDNPSPWRARQARWSIPDLTEAIRLQCRSCNDEDRFLDSNDCASPACPLFPFRPGTCRPEVDGVRRAVRQRRGRRGNAANPRNKRGMATLFAAIGAEAGLGIPPPAGKPGGAVS